MEEILSATNEPPQPPAPAPPPPLTREQVRFQLELEFVQCLANPQYLQYLAQNQYFQDTAFIRFLAYLKYWQQPNYAKFIIYPYCLELLELLQNKDFRDKLVSAETALFLHQQEFYHWQWLADRQFNNPSISASSSSTLPPIDSALLEDAEKEEINRDILRKVLLHGRAAAIAALEKASSNENANSGGGGGQQQLQS